MKIAVIIVTYNAEKWVNDCFDSLRNCSVPIKTIVIDNASSDKTTDIIKKDYPEIDLICSNINLGFGKANNIGIIKAYKEDFEYIVLLNQDAYVFRDTIHDLVAIHCKNNKYGILSPIHLADDGAVVDKTFMRYLVNNSNSKLLSDVITNNYSCDVYDFVFINAAIWSISRACIEKVGGFDPLFSHYGEDVDYCNRVLNSGFKIGVVPKIKAVHNRSQLPSRITINFVQKRFIEYLLFFKKSNTPFYIIFFRHSFFISKNLFILFVKLKFNDISILIKTNLKLFFSFKQIKLSRKEQNQKLAFIRELN